MKLRALAFLLPVLACSTSSEPAGTVSSAIVKGTESDDATDATVLVMHYDALASGGGAASGCTGSLLAPRLVLTARHCVSVTDEGAACDRSGKAIAGGGIDRDHDPAKIYVFGGKERPDFLAGTARPVRGKEILTTGATTLCNNDIALIVLEGDVPGVPIAPVRLDAPARTDEVITAVGWGISEKANNPPKRLQKSGIAVLAIGPADGLGPAEFRVGEGPCAGDSGGPALAPSGAVLGALSRGGNGKKGNGAEVCVGGTNIFTSVAGHAAFVRAGYAKVGQEPWLEGEPSPLLKSAVAPAAAPPDEDDGCNASGRRFPHGSTAFTLAVLFAITRRRNPAKSRTNSGPSGPRRTSDPG